MRAKRLFEMAMVSGIVALLVWGCSAADPFMKAKAQPFQPMQENGVTAVDLAKEPILFRFGHRYGHELKEKRIEDHQIVHEMRELLLDAAPDDLELFRRGFRLGYGRDGFRVFDQIWEEAQSAR